MMISVKSGGLGKETISVILMLLPYVNFIHFCHPEERGISFKFIL